MTTSSSSSLSSSTSPCLFPSSLSSLFLSCIQARKDKKERHKPDSLPKPTTPTTPTTTSASTCTCTYTYPTPTALPQLPGTGLHRNSICITQATSIRIVESDSSSEYDSSSSDSNSVSDYGCDCWSPHYDHGHDHNQDDEHVCEVDGIDLPETSQPAIKRSLSNRPLPPLPGQYLTGPGSSSNSGSRKLPEIKTCFIEDTIPEEDEDEYLAQCKKEEEEEELKWHKRTTSRRKSMIELFNLSSTFTSDSGSGTRPCSGSGTPRLSFSFSNLNFRFPLPPVWGGQAQQTQSREEEPERKEKRRPMSMYIPPTSTSASALMAASTATPKSQNEEETPPLHKTLTQSTDLPSTTTTISATTTTTTTKKERRMGTVLFPPLALLSRSSVTGNRDSTGSGRSLFC
ncbi:hypothetical protein BDV12DRAFT_204511 [Aspergillus spectabilis]